MERPQTPPNRRPQVDASYDPESSVPPPTYVPRPRSHRRHSAPTEIEFPLPNEEGSSPSEHLSLIASPLGRRGSPPSVDGRPRVPVSAHSFQNPRKDELESSFSDLPSPVQVPAKHRATVSELPNRFTVNDEYDSSLSEASPPPSKASKLKVSEYDDEHDGKAGGSPRTPNVKSGSDVRRIFYTVAEDDGQVLAHDDESFGSFLFKGHSLGELTEQLQLETGINDDIVLCMRNPLTSKLYKMRLQLPPNKAPLSIVVVRHDSQCMLLAPHLSASGRFRTIL